MMTRFTLRSLAIAVCSALISSPAHGQAAAEAERLEQEFVQARAEWNKALRKAAADKDTQARAELLKDRPAPRFVARFTAGARTHAGTPGAVPFLIWLVRNTRGEEVLGHVHTLMDGHVTDPRIRLAVARIAGIRQDLGAQKSRELLDKVIAKSPHPDVRAQARFTRASGYVGTRALERSEPLRQLAIRDLKQVLSDKSVASLQRLAKGLLFEAENLEPGLKAPDIQGEDLDGIAFKLSDYAGKVILLDFWGDW